MAERGRGARRTRPQARAPARPGVPGRAARASSRTAARSSRTARCCRSRPWTSRAHGWVNLHFSLLPAWRGAAPVQRSIWAGDEVTGATTFRIVKELDAGPTYGVMTETIRPDDTAGDLLDRLAEGGAGLLVATLDGIADGIARGTRRSRPRASGSRPRSPSTTRGSTGPGRPSAIDRQVRACTPAPGAWTTYAGERVKLGPLAPADGQLRPGEIVAGKNAVLVGTGTAAVRLGEVKAFGSKQMPAADWARGLRCVAGGRCWSMSRKAQSRGRRHDLRAPARGRARHLLGRRPTYKVQAEGDKGRGFVLARAPRTTAIDPETGEEYQDLLVIRTANAEDKAALVEADGPFFTIDHFHNYNAVLLQQSRIGEIDRRRAPEVLTDAWLAVAPKSLAKKFLAGEP